jgi:hypothetical protein
LIIVANCRLNTAMSLSLTRLPLLKGSLISFWRPLSSFLSMASGM